MSDTLQNVTPVFKVLYEGKVVGIAFSKKEVKEIIYKDSLENARELLDYETEKAVLVPKRSLIEAHYKIQEVEDEKGWWTE